MNKRDIGFGTGELFASAQPEKQNTLNNLKSLSIRIPGLKYIPEFISEDEHSSLWTSVNGETWLDDLRRRVQHYGYKYDYKARAINYDMYLGKLPAWSEMIIDRINESSLMKGADQLIVNEYEPGQGIAPHVDCEPCFKETIISLSLGSPVVMEFTNKKTREKVEVWLEPRSLVVMQSEARYDWTHGIPARKRDKFNGVPTERRKRISLTFRKVFIRN